MDKKSTHSFYWSLLLKGLFLLLPFIYVLPVGAQGHIITVKVMVKSEDTKVDPVSKKPISVVSYVPKENVHVFGFWDVKKGREALKKYDDNQAGYRLDRAANSFGETNARGVVELRKMTLDGYIICVTEKGTGSFKGEPFSGGEIEIRMDDEGKKMKDVVIKGDKIKRDPNRPIVPIACGNTLPFTYNYFVDGDSTYTNARIGISPIAIVMGTNEIAKVMRPVVIDGKEYHQTMYRRMGFDMINDGLAAWIDTTKFMQQHEPVHMEIVDTLYPIDETQNYPIYGDIWIEDYNGQIKRSRKLLSEGYAKRPMRFLEFTLPRIDIDTALYRREGVATMQDDKRTINVQFQQGRKELDMSDSLTAVGVNQLIANIGRYYNNEDAGITNAYIKGYASPEGNYARNQQLSNERARFFQSDIISAKFPNIKFESVTAEVIPWSEVVSELLKRGKTEYAEQVNRVIEAHPQNMDAQFLKIKNMSFYPFLKDSILPLLRKVDFSFTYFTYKVRSPQEILDMYNTRDDYKDGTACQDYELYQLFRFFHKDYKRLEPLARAAYKVVKDDAEDRPWPLAAYYLGRCYLERNVVDTTLLLPFLETDTAIVLAQRTNFFQRRDEMGNLRGFFNDPSIVALHIAMLCRAKDYKKANKYGELLPDTEEYNQLRYLLKCLDCGWDQPEVRDAVAETSLWNKIIIYAAQSDSIQYMKTALLLLTDSTLRDSLPKDPRVKYQEAILRWELSKQHDEDSDTEWAIRYFRYVTDEDFDVMFASAGETCQGKPWIKNDWGFPMAECCYQDEKYLQIMKNDGYFSAGYKKAFEKHWPKLKAYMKQKIETEEQERKEQEAQRKAKAEVVNELDDSSENSHKSTDGNKDD